MSAFRSSSAVAFGLAFLLGACDRKPTAEGESAPAAKASAVTTAGAPNAPHVDFERIDSSTIQMRGVPGGTEGRYIARPAVVSSPCGFHLVVSGAKTSFTTVLVGHELGWTKTGAPLLLQLDGLTLDVGIVDQKAMGAEGPLSPEARLNLAGQWESAWLGREAGGQVAVKDNARGQAHLEPHPAWRVWSATLGGSHVSADAPTTNVVVATVALDERVLFIRALLDGEKLALRALRRLVFAVDSIESHPGALARKAYMDSLEQALAQDPKCAGIHDAHDAQLQ